MPAEKVRISLEVGTTVLPAMVETMTCALVAFLKEFIVRTRRTSCFTRLWFANTWLRTRAPAACICPYFQKKLLLKNLE